MKKMMIMGMGAIIVGIISTVPDVQAQAVTVAEEWEACDLQTAPPPPPHQKKCDEMGVVGADTGGFVPFLRGTFKISPDTHLNINGLGPLTLSYANRYVNVSALGKSWTSIADTRIFYDLPACVKYKFVVLRHANGNNYLYQLMSDGTYRHPAGWFAELRKNADGTWDQTSPDGETYHFNSKGRLERVIDRNGRTVSFEYSVIPVSEQSAPRSYLDDFENKPWLNWTTPAEEGYDPQGCHYADVRYNLWDIDITADPDKVINGNYSVRLKKVGGPYYYNFLLCSSRNLLKPNTTYRVSFRYKCLEALTTGNYRVGFWNSLQVGGALVSVEGGITMTPQAGEEGEASFVYKTKNTENYVMYLLQLGNTTKGELILDDIMIEEVSSQEPATREEVIRITDAVGNAINLSYNGRGRMEKATDSSGQEVSFGYNEYDDLTAIIDPAGNITQFAYDDSHNLVAIQDANGNLEQISYMQGKDVVNEVMSADGGVHTFWRDYAKTKLEDMTTYYVDPNGNMIASMIYMSSGVYPIPGTYSEVERLRIYPDGSRREAQWTPDTRRMTQESFADIVTGEIITNKYEYDAYGRNTLIRDALGNETRYTFHPTLHDKVTSVRDAQGNLTQYAYDSQGNLVTEIDPLGNVTAYTYDGRGNQTSVTNPKGVTTFTYDVKDNLLMERDPLGNQTSHTYDSRGNRTSTTDPLGRTAVYEYNILDRLISVTDPLGNKTAYAYDGNGNRIAVMDPQGNTTLYQYDGGNRLIAVTDPLGNTTAYAYDGNDNRIAIADPKGNITRYFYDCRDRLIGVENPLGNVAAYTYDGRGNRLTTTDPEGNMTLSAYNRLNQLTSAMNAASNIVSYTYDSLGRRVTVTDSKGATTYAYDSLGRIILITDAAGNNTGFTYDEVGNRTSTTDSLGRTNQYVYDAVSRLISAIDPAGQTTTYQYNSSGNRTAAMDAQGNTTRYEYDALNRVITVIDPKGGRTTYQYDTRGNRIAVTDPEGNKTQYEYDADNRLIAEIDPANGRTIYAYDQNGNRISVTDPLGRITRYEYDSLNRVTAVIDPLGARTVYAYNANGNLASKSDPNGNTFTFVYDGVGNTASKTYPDGKVYTWTYDAQGSMLTKSINGALLEQNTYDILNRLISRAITGKGSISYTYDTVGNILTFMDQQSGITQYAYDLLDRMTALIDPDNKTTSYVYDSLGRRTMRTYPNGCVSAYDYDPKSELVKVSNLGPRRQLISSYSYLYDRAGKRTRLTEPDKTIVYSYDRKSQLTGAEVSRKRDRFRTERLYDVHYTYDAAGNRIAMEIDGGQLPVQSYAPTHDRQPQLRRPTRVEYSYNDADQLVTESAYRLERRRRDSRAWETEYAYDANGNVIAKQLQRHIGTKAQREDEDGLAPGQHTTSYEYDYQNLLNKITYPDGETNTFQNCRCGTFRLQKVDSQGLRNYLYDKENDSPIFECDENYNPLVKYIKGPRIDELISKKYLENGQWKTVYYLYDGLGSVRQLTDERGRVVAEYDYLPFGEIIEAQGGQARKNPFTFTGREFDRDSGLYYYRARYMDPRVGRFTSVDPIIRQADGIGRSMQHLTGGMGCGTCGGGMLPVSVAGSTLAYGHAYVYVKNDPIDRYDAYGLVANIQGCSECPEANTAASIVDAVILKGACRKWFEDHGHDFSAGGIGGNDWIPGYSISCHTRCKLPCLAGRVAWTYPGFGIGVCINKCREVGSIQLAVILIHEIAHHYCPPLFLGGESCANSAVDACSGQIASRGGI